MSQAPRPLSLHLERSLPAPRLQIFTMLTEPALFAQWWGPKGYTTGNIALDVRVGGEYRIEMLPPEGDAFFLGGEFRRVDPPVHVSYTFRYEEPDPDDRETVVVVRLEDLGDSTKLTLDQGPFLTEARRALHDQGWTESLDRLRHVVANRDRSTT
jgi:uncharacterized protein YndB with AHSA1/START domain